jgi:hypothetical protein
LASDINPPKLSLMRSTSIALGLFPGSWQGIQLGEMVCTVRGETKSRAAVAGCFADELDAGVQAEFGVDVKGLLTMNAA